MSRPIKRRIIDIKEERAYDRKYREVLQEMGAFVLKIEAKHIKGLPDTHITPDVWIEFKRVRWLSIRPIDLQSHIEPLQHYHLREFAKSGCRCYVGIFWDFGTRGEFVQTMEYEALMRHPTWTHDLTADFAHPITELRDHVRHTWAVEGRHPRIHSAAEATVRLAR